MISGSLQAAICVLLACQPRPSRQDGNALLALAVPAPPLLLQAFSNVLRRFLEAAGRGIWKADPDMLQKLQQMYAELDEEIEGVSI